MADVGVAGILVEDKKATLADFDFFFQIDQFIDEILELILGLTEQVKGESRRLLRSDAGKFRKVSYEILKLFWKHADFICERSE